MSEEQILRMLLWIRHGCPFHALYGDDGEMQCSACGIDFKRDSAKHIEERFIKINEPEIKAFFAKAKESSNIKEKEEK